MPGPLADTGTELSASSISTITIILKTVFFIAIPPLQLNGFVSNPFTAKRIDRFGKPSAKIVKFPVCTVFGAIAGSV
jgi:hypothetical protein